MQILEPPGWPTPLEGPGTAVLLLHAGVTDRRSWDLLVDRLGDDYRTIAYDRRGFGETTYQPEPHVETDDALAVLEAEGVTSAVVIGASNGGRRAVDLALAHPARDLFLDMNGIALRAADPGPEEASEPAWDRLGAIDVPTLVLCGDLDMLSTQGSEHLASAIPGARYEQLRDTGHLPHYEGHPRALEVIAEFVAGVA